MQSSSQGKSWPIVRGTLQIAALLLIPACGSHNQATLVSPSVEIKGNAQKGPMLAGSSIEAHTLDATLASTGAVYSTQLLSDLGSFDFTRSFAEGFLEVIAQGFFYDEMTAALSGAQLTLRALASTAGSADLRVNIATTIAAARIRHLVGQSMAFDAAAAQAKIEFFQVFNLDATTFSDLNHMDITGTAPGDTALIAVSATLLQYASERAADPGQKVAQLAAIISTLSSELEGTGIVGSIHLLRDLAGSAHRLDLQTVRTNLQAIYAGQGVTLTISDLAPYITPLASTYPWRFGIAPPVVRGLPSGAAVGGAIYFVGGNDQGANPPASTVDVYQFSPSTLTWTAKAPMPTPRYSHTCVELGGQLFAIGGRDLLNAYHAEVEEYTPTSNTWTSLASLPLPRYDACSASVGGKIYVIGGGSNTATQSNTVYGFNPTANSWQSLASMPTARSQAGCAVINDKIYVVGGSNAAGGSSAVEVYDPATDSWAISANLGTALTGSTVAALNGKIYSIAGSDGTGKVTGNQVYDPALNQWTPKTPLDIPRFMAVPAVLNGEVYVIGSNTIGTVQSDVEVYDPTKDN